MLCELQASDPARWLVVPEAAPELFRRGLDAAEPRFQKEVVRLQIEQEQSCLAEARAGQVILCHRGTLDALAYWLMRGWRAADFFPETMPERAHIARYAGVLHLETAAIGAADFYTRWPQAHRPETAAQAAAIDGACTQAWAAHPYRIAIANQNRTWSQKAAAARDAIESCLARVDQGRPGCAIA